LALVRKANIFCIGWQFLQRVNIACYAERCFCLIVNPSVRLSVRLSHAGTVSKRLKLYDHGVFTGG